MSRNHLLIIITLLSVPLSKDIHLITTNDVHGVIAPQKAYFMNPNFPPDILGWAAYYKYVKNLRIEAKHNNEAVLLLDGGNFFQGTPLGMFDNGKTIIEWFNRVEYDAIVPGRFDFISGAANLNNLINIADFPFLGANLICNDCPIISKNFKPYIIQKIQGIKIGILGIINSGIKITFNFFS